MVWGWLCAQIIRFSLVLPTINVCIFTELLFQSHCVQDRIDLLDPENFWCDRMFQHTTHKLLPGENNSKPLKEYWDVKNPTWWARRPCSCLQSWTSRPSLSPGQPSVRAGVCFCSSRLLCVVNSLQHFDWLNKKSCKHYSKIETLCPFPSPISMNTDIMFRSSSIVMTCFE